MLSMWVSFPSWFHWLNPPGLFTGGIKYAVFKKIQIIDFKN